MWGKEEKVPQREMLKKTRRRAGMDVVNVGRNANEMEQTDIPKRHPPPPRPLPHTPPPNPKVQLKHIFWIVPPVLKNLGKTWWTSQI